MTVTVLKVKISMSEVVHHKETRSWMWQRRTWQSVAGEGIAGEDVAEEGIAGEDVAEEGVGRQAK